GSYPRAEPRTHPPRPCCGLSRDRALGSRVRHSRHDRGDLAPARSHRRSRRDKRHDQARGWRPILGDSDVDVQTAKVSGVPVILVSFGYAATLLANLEAEATIDHFDQLDVCAATLLAAKTRRSAPS